MSPICFSSSATRILAMGPLLRSVLSDRRLALLRKQHPEPGALARLAVHRQATVVGLDDRFGYDQPQSGPARLGDHRTIAAEELGKELALLGRTHADTGVTHDHFDQPISRMGL